MTPEDKLTRAIQKVISDPYSALEGKSTMANDNQKKVEEANQKIADARGGNVVSEISAFGTPSTYEDPNHPEGKAIAQLDEERTQDVDKFHDAEDSVEKAQEVAAEEAVANAEAQVAQAEAEAKASDK